MNINYTKVHHFLTIVKYMSLNKASKELYISQPALSLSLSRLEEDLGTTLLYRSGNKLVLSKEGEALLPRFEQIHKDYESLLAEAKSFQRFDDDYLSISFSGSVILFSTLYMTGFLNKYKGISVKKCFVDIEQATHMLLTDQIDFAISYPPISNNQITTVSIMEEPIGLALPKDHALAQLDRVNIKDIHKLQVHGLTKQNYFRQMCDEFCLAHNVQPSYVTEEEYPIYLRRIRTEMDDAAYFSTLDNFARVFPKDHYVYKDVENKNMIRRMGMSFLTAGKKQYRYDGFVEYVQSNIQAQYHYHLEYVRMMQRASEALVI